MNTSKLIILLSIISSGLLLSACGDDSETASAPAMESAPAEMASDSNASMSMEKAEGVVYQDEIYANWPYN